MRRLLETAREAALETLSPTRCASCERLGYLVCDRCLGRLELIDPRLCCSRCGSPFGSLLCTECDPEHADETARASASTAPPAAPGATMVPGAPPDAASGPHPDPHPLGRCLAVSAYSGPAPRIVRAYKDEGERRLAGPLAEMVLDAALHAEECAPDRYGGLLSRADAVTFVPATAAAFRRREFDHMEDIARRLGELAGVRVVDAMVKRGRGDQRKLGRRGRLAQDSDLYEVVGDVRGQRLLLLDDVITTGATLRAAAGALRDAGAASVDGLAFARVW